MQDQLPEGMKTELTPLEEKTIRETYLCYCNLHRPGYKEGQQVWNSYGNRNNDFLLLNYGFAFADNKYDSHGIRLRMDLNLKETI